MWIIRIWPTEESLKDKNIAYEEVHDSNTLLARISELLDEKYLFDVYECKCVFDRS